MKKRGRNFAKNLKNATFIGLSIVFGYLILQGALALLPSITGTVMIVVGVIGLAFLGFWGFNKK